MAITRKQLISLAKILFSGLLLYFIFTKIPLKEILGILKRAKLLYVLGALVLFVLSKIIAAFRLNLYFHQLGIFLSQKSNLKLYILGMFYNLFLPGGIGGDAYKGYVIRTQFEISTKRTVAVLVLDRLSGMLLLFVYACILGLISVHASLIPYRWLFASGIFLSILVFLWVNRKYFSYVMPVYWRSLGYSALVQLAQLLCVLLILKALAVEGNTILYLLVFLVSSIVAVLPLTLGGIGSRELVFYYGAVWLGLEEHTSVGISMMFFLITAFVSLWGIWYHFRKPSLYTSGT